jgi:hypothetical protein
VIQCGLLIYLIKSYKYGNVEPKPHISVCFVSYYNNLWKTLKRAINLTTHSVSTILWARVASSFIKYLQKSLKPQNLFLLLDLCLDTIKKSSFSETFDRGFIRIVILKTRLVGSKSPTKQTAGNRSRWQNLFLLIHSFHQFLLFLHINIRIRL